MSSIYDATRLSCLPQGTHPDASNGLSDQFAAVLDRAGERSGARMPIQNPTQKKPLKPLIEYPVVNPQPAKIANEQPAVLLSIRVPILPRPPEGTGQTLPQPRVPSIDLPVAKPQPVTVSVQKPAIPPVQTSSGDPASNRPPPPHLSLRSGVQ